MGQYINVMIKNYSKLLPLKRWNMILNKKDFPVQP